MNIKNVVQIVSFVTVLTHGLTSFGMLGSLVRKRNKDQQMLTDTSQDSINKFNTEYTDTQRQKAQDLKNMIRNAEAPEIAKFLETSTLTRREEQAYLVVKTVGDDKNAIDSFKEMPAGNAIKRARRSATLRIKTNNRISKSDAFLLTDQQDALCNHILDNAKQKTDKKYLLINAAMYNNIAHLPPHIRKAVGKGIIAVLNKTTEEKLVGIGLYTLGGAMSGGLVGGTVGGLAKSPKAVTNAVLAAAPTIAMNATDTFLKEFVSFDSKAVDALCENPDPINPDTIIDQKTLKQLQAGVTINDFKKARKKASRQALEEGIQTTQNATLSFDITNAKQGALAGTATGAFAGFAFGAYQATQPTKEFEISKMKSYKKQ